MNTSLPRMSEQQTSGGADNSTQGQSGDGTMHASNVIQVSSSKHSLFFYINLAKRFMHVHNEIELSGLGLAISTVVTIAEILKNNRIADQISIETSTVDLIDEERRERPLQKPKITIKMRKSDTFDSIVKWQEEMAEMGLEDEIMHSMD